MNVDRIFFDDKLERLWDIDIVDLIDWATN